MAIERTARISDVRDFSSGARIPTGEAPSPIRDPSRPDRLFAAGDGHIVAACRASATHYGIPDEAVRIEHFFNQPSAVERT